MASADSPKATPQTATSEDAPKPSLAATKSTLTPSNSAALTAAERALRESLEPREFRDVYLYSFSRRTIFPDGSVRIDKPQPVVAIGSILKDTGHFLTLLTSGFSESAQDLDLDTDSDDGSPVRQCALESEYDYEMDSDLDEFEEADGSAYHDTTNVASPSSSGSSSSKGKGRADSKDTANAPDPVPHSKPTHQESVSHRILIPNIAHRTLKACVFYLYTGKTNFLPLSSEGAAARRLALLTTFDNGAPACSPKSMYRLAEAYGISELQILAYKEIISHLTPENIVEEAFSSFFARYPSLAKYAASYLSLHYADRAVQQNVPDAIEKIVFGYMPHASAVLRSLLGLRAAVSVAPPKPAAASESVAKGSTPSSSATFNDFSNPRPPSLPSASLPQSLFSRPVPTSSSATCDSIRDRPEDVGDAAEDTDTSLDAPKKKFRKKNRKKA